MKGGFSFKGMDIASLSLHYVPEREDTYVYRPTETSVHEEIFDGHDGGYFYGVTKQPKEFNLRCYFESKHINKGVMEKIRWLFKKGTSGQLVFETRPWCYYYATVIELDDKEIFNYENGIIKVTMKAYYPFARSDLMIYEPNWLNYYDVIESTAFLESYDMMPVTNLLQLNEGPTAYLPVPATGLSFELYNPGTEYADVGIEIAGEAPEGITIKNLTTNEECKFVALTDAETTDQNRFVYLDGINGKCVLQTINPNTGNVISSSLNYLYHDHGFIRLAPDYPAKRVYISRQPSGANYTINTIENLYDPESETLEFANQIYAGKRIYLIDKWYTIDHLNNSSSIQVTTALNLPSSQTFPFKAVIASCNKLKIKVPEACTLSRIKFNYKATFA